MKFHCEVEVSEWVFGGEIQVAEDVADNIIGKCFPVA